MQFGPSCRNPIEDLRCLIRISVGLAVIVAISTVVGCGSGYGGSESIIEKAREARQLPAIRESAIELRSLLQRAPDNAEARAELARINMLLTNIAAARKEVEKAISLGDQRASTQVLRARILFEGGAFAELRDMIPPEDDASAHAEVLSLQTEARLELGDEEGASTTLAAARQLDPEGAAVQMATARMLAHDGDIEAATDALRDVVTQFPLNGRAWRVLAAFHQVTGDKSAAIEALRKALPLVGVATPERYRIALLLLTDGKFKEAEPVIEQILAEAPKDPRSQFVSGLLAYGQGNFKAAIDRFMGINESARANLRELNFYEGVAALALGKHEQAVQRLRLARDAIPTSPEVSYHLALAYLSINDTQSAEEALHATLVADPLNVNAIELLGKIAMSTQRADEGIGYLREVAALKESSVPAFLQLGRSLVAAGRLDEGVAAFQEASKLDSFAGAEGLVATLLESNRISDARAEVDRLLASPPSLPLEHNLNGLVLVREGKEASAREAFEHALSLDAGYMPAIYNLALLDLQSGLLDQAVDRLVAASEAYPGDIRLRSMLAEVHLRQRDVAKAKATLTQGLAIAPENPILNVAMARILLLERAFTSAINHLQTVRKRFPKNAAILSLLGHAYVETRQLEQAVSVLTTASTALADDPSISYALARAYALKGDYARFAKELERTLEIDPDYFPARLAMVRLEARNGNRDAARRRLNAIAQDYPKQVHVITLQADFAMEEGNYSEAISKLAVASEELPGRRDLQLKLAATHMLAGNANEAIKTMNAWLQLNPEDQVALNFLAELQILSGDKASGLDTYRDILKSNPDNSLALNNLAWFLQEENLSSALSLIKRAYELAPDEPTVLHTYGVLLAKANDLAESKAMLSKYASKRFEEIRAEISSSRSHANLIVALQELMEYEFPEKSDARVLLAEMTEAKR